MLLIAVHCHVTGLVTIIRGCVPMSRHVHIRTGSKNAHAYLDHPNMHQISPYSYMHVHIHTRSKYACANLDV